ncbi:MAG: NUDIX domain-containing protein [Candidatus Liptonbacteria bacterium]|nr:NUDIX domain-containing protein [Candidatus Liptonbacteria bacterium]
MAAKERFKIIPSIYALFIKDGKILLSRRFQTGYEDGNYGLPSGHAEGGETFREAMAREAAEEVGVQVALDDLSLALTMHRWCGDHERIDFFFAVSKWNGEIKNMEPDKCDDLDWFPLDHLPENTIPYIRYAIQSFSNKIPYSEFGWGTHKDV